MPAYTPTPARTPDSPVSTGLSGALTSNLYALPLLYAAALFAAGIAATNWLWLRPSLVLALLALVAPLCVLAAARYGKTLATFRGTAEGIILDAPRGMNGFGYDPLFYFPQIKKTFAELSAEEKSKYSHRGAAFREFLGWCEQFTAN